MTIRVSNEHYISIRKHLVYLKEAKNQGVTKISRRSFSSKGFRTPPDVRCHISRIPTVGKLLYSNINLLRYIEYIYGNNFCANYFEYFDQKITLWTRSNKEMLSLEYPLVVEHIGSLSPVRLKSTLLPTVR